jgi:hypothetical protein
MEPVAPALTQPIFTTYDTIVGIGADSGNWFFITLGNRFFTGPSKPDFARGDTVRITIQKVNPDDLAR